MPVARASLRPCRPPVPCSRSGASRPRRVPRSGGNPARCDRATDEPRATAAAAKPPRFALVVAVARPATCSRLCLANAWSPVPPSDLDRLGAVSGHRGPAGARAGFELTLCRPRHPAQGQPAEREVDGALLVAFVGPGSWWAAQAPGLGPRSAVRQRSCARGRRAPRAIVVAEQNALPGAANRLAAASQGVSFLPRTRCPVVVTAPRAPEVLAIDGPGSPAARAKLDIEPGRRRCLIFGGSLGALPSPGSLDAPSLAGGRPARAARDRKRDCAGSRPRPPVPPAHRCIPALEYDDDMPQDGRRLSLVCRSGAAPSRAPGRRVAVGLIRSVRDRRPPELQRPPRSSGAPRVGPTPS